MSPNDVLEKAEETMWRGRFIGNTGDEFRAMNKTKVMGCNDDSGNFVVLDFWGVEEPEDGCDDVEDSVIDEEEEEASAGKYYKEKKGNEEEREAAGRIWPELGQIRDHEDSKLFSCD